MRKTKSKRKVAKRNTRRYKKRNTKRTSKRKPVKRRRITRRRRIQKGGEGDIDLGYTLHTSTMKSKEECLVLLKNVLEKLKLVKVENKIMNKFIQSDDNMKNSFEPFKKNEETAIKAEEEAAAAKAAEEKKEAHKRGTEAMRKRLEEMEKAAAAKAAKAAEEAAAAKAAEEAAAAKAAEEKKENKHRSFIPQFIRRRL